MSTTDTAPLLRVGDVAQHLDLSAKTVRRRVADGSLKSVRLGPSARAPIRVTPGAIDEFLQSSAAPGGDRGEDRGGGLVVQPASLVSTNPERTPDGDA